MARYRCCFRLGGKPVTVIVTTQSRPRPVLASSRAEKEIPTSGGFGDPRSRKSSDPISVLSSIPSICSTKFCTAGLPAITTTGSVRETETETETVCASVGIGHKKKAHVICTIAITNTFRAFAGKRVRIPGRMVDRTSLSQLSSQLVNDQELIN